MADGETDSGTGTGAGTGAGTGGTGEVKGGGGADKVAGLVAELADETLSLEAVLDPLGLSAETWALPTPAPRWTVAHQVAHLAWTDEQALLAVTDERRFRRAAEAARRAPDTFVDEGAQQGAALPPEQLRDRWRDGRTRLWQALEQAPEGHRLPWYGPPMSVSGMATARIMETWAHGEDVAETLGVQRAPTERLRHVVWIAVRARDFAFTVHGLEPPARPFRVELTGPAGQLWAHGPEDAEQRVSGAALDFCLLATQRLHRDDAAVRAEGAEAERWLAVAQAFAGPPGAGRARGGRRHT